jgi:hypothetical protein
VSALPEKAVKRLVDAGWHQAGIDSLCNYLSLRTALPLITIEMIEVFAEGSLETVESLARMLKLICPEHGDLPLIHAAAARLGCGLAVSFGGPGKGRSRQWSIPLGEVPASMLDEIDRMDVSEKKRRDTLFTLRQIFGAARRAALPEVLDRAALTAFRRELDLRDLKARTIVTELVNCGRLAKCFDSDPDIHRLLRVEIRAAELQAASEASKRHLDFRMAPVTPIDYARQAHAVLTEARDSKLSRQSRQHRHVTAAILAFLSVMPERISDLVKMIFGRDLIRDAGGWRSDLFSNKTDQDRSFARLPAELTPYLDALILLGADPGPQDAVLWRLYHQRVAMGSPVFARIDLCRPYSPNRIFELVKARTGHGPHAARKAMADYLPELDAPMAEVLALLGHRSVGTTQKHYEIHAARSRRSRSLERLSRLRSEQNGEGDFRTPSGRLVEPFRLNRRLRQATGRKSATPDGGEEQNER